MKGMDKNEARFIRLATKRAELLEQQDRYREEQARVGLASDRWGVVQDTLVYLDRALSTNARELETIGVRIG